MIINFLLDSEEKVFGDVSVKMETYCHPSTPEHIYKSGAGGAVHWVDVKPNTTYTLSYYVKTDSPENVKAIPTIWEPTRQQYEYISLSSGWQRITFTFTTGPETASIIVNAAVHTYYTETVTGWKEGEFYTSWIDGVQLEEGETASPFHTTFISCPGILLVTIDIKPGSDPNCFNNDGHGVIPVAIFSSADFDATQVDPSTVFLDGQGVRVVGKGNTQAHIEDVNGDGLVDLVVQIEDTDGTYEEGDTIATLTGETFDGTQVQGTDTICIVP